MQTTHFERAIFLSWYCSKRDCAFCYLSSKPHIKPDPKKDRRSLASIFAEAIICKACNWKVEFLSGGCDTFNDEELLDIIKTIYEITGQKQWLNLGILNKSQLELFKPYIEGICGTVECITPKLRDKICPSKPLGQIEQMFKLADKLNIEKTMTLILGLGETIEDFKHLKKFIIKHNLKRITFYRLKPQKNTIFQNAEPISSDYYEKWIKLTKDSFPDIEIIVGSWLTHLDELHLLLNAGAKDFTKFPSIRKFNSKYAKTIEAECKLANRKLISNLTKVPKIDMGSELERLHLDKKLKQDIKLKLASYLQTMSKNR